MSAMVEIEQVEPQWPVESDGDWTYTTTPHLPFLQWHEHTQLRPVGACTLAMPASPFFSLFLSKGNAQASSYQRRRGVSGYEEGDWRVDRMHAGKCRRVKYDVEVADDAKRRRRVTVKEQQRCVPIKDGFLYEVRSFESGREGDMVASLDKDALGRGAETAAAWDPFGPDGDAFPFVSCERWTIVETKGYVRASTTVTVFASCPAVAGSAEGVWREAAVSRFEAWHAVATERSYSDAVLTMMSDSLFGSAVGPKKAKDAKQKLVAYVAPVPPSRVDVVLQGHTL